jgi:hypothetical protein
VGIGNQLGCNQRVTTTSGHLRDHDLTTMTLSQQQQSTRANDQQDNIDMSVPIVWNSASSSYQAINTMPTSSGYQQQMACHQTSDGNNSNMIEGETGDNVQLMGMNVIETCNNLKNMIGQHQINPCQQCARVKSTCPAQQMVVNNNAELNGAHLSSLAVDDLDENELIECLAACDPDVHLYDIQNNTYSTQYNIYREQ